MVGPLVIGVTGALVSLAVGCGDAPPPPAKSEAPKKIRVHVTNASRFDVCKIESCGEAGKAITEGGRDIGALKPHEAGLFEVKKCSGATLKAIACPKPEESTPPCLKAEGGYVDEGTMFRVQTCSL